MEYAMSTSQQSHPSIDFARVASPDGCLLTAEEVAEILRVPRSWAYSHLSDLPTIRLGRYVRFKRSDVERFLEDRGPCQ
jgi:excisionase family DNA binding protein